MLRQLTGQAGHVSPQALDLLGDDLALRSAFRQPSGQPGDQLVLFLQQVILLDQRLLQNSKSGSGVQPVPITLGDQNPHDL